MVGNSEDRFCGVEDLISQTKANLKPAKQRLIQQDSDQPLLLMMQDFLIPLASHLIGSVMQCLISVGSQNLVTLLFAKTTFCQRGNTKRMAHILSNSHISRPVRTPLKNIKHMLKVMGKKIFPILRSKIFCLSKPVS